MLIRMLLSFNNPVNSEVANGKIVKCGLFKDIWIQPATGDAGGAIGPAYTSEQIAQALDTAPGFNYQALTEDELIQHAFQSLADGKVIGWFQGRMEFGSCALGARSILGDPRAPDMQSLINQKIKFRESFRPFAPSVLREDVQGFRSGYR